MMEELFKVMAAAYESPPGYEIDYGEAAAQKAKEGRDMIRSAMPSSGYSVAGR